MTRPFAAGALCAVVAVVPIRGLAEPGPCAFPLDPASAVSCARAASPELRHARAEANVIAARRRGAAVVVPARPQLSASAAFRTNGASADGNAYLTLTQEVELGDRRGLRLQENDAESGIAAAVEAVAAHEAAGAGLRALVEAVAAAEYVEVARRVRDDSVLLATDVRRRVEAALLPAVEARLAELEALRAEVALGEAVREEEAARQRLAFVTGTAGAPAVPVGPTLTRLLETLAIPDPSGLPLEAVSRRPELALQQAEIARWSATARLLRSATQPNLSPFVTVQRDGFGEWVAGGGLSLPLPLGGDVAPDRSAEAAEAEARLVQARLDEEAMVRRIRNEAERAVQAVEAAHRQRALFSDEVLASTATTLGQIRREASEGRLPLRDALLLQRTLADLTRQAHDARVAAARALVELIRAAASGWPGESR